MNAPARIALTTLGVGLILACAARGSRAESRATLALPLISTTDRPTLIFAQRVIDQSWGTSDDSVYVELEVPEWRSESVALLLSAGVPGAGQTYAGDRSGLWFALAEMVGWTARQLYRHRGAQLRDDAGHFAGTPTDSSSRWSFARWSQATQGDAGSLRALYAADREVFYDLIASDPRYAAGWGGDPAASQTYFRDLRSVSDDRLRAARFASSALWVNHLIAAVGALRSARLHNVPLRRNLELKLDGGWHHGSPSVFAALERRF